LRRERRALKKLRDERLRDLGGLMLELYRRGTFREDLVAEQCAQLVGIDDRLATVDAALHRGHAERRCACGTPILRGAHFCPSCGRGVAPLRPQTAAEETVIQTTPEG
jgi:transposase